MKNSRTKTKVSILPKLAISNIKNNASTYFPYMGVSIFAMFTFFSFDLILRNDIIKTLPKASYAGILISIGFVLLAIILVPFLYYTNSYLIKRRKRELGLYNILGMEKKHIGLLMCLENLVMYGIVSTGAILFGALFSKFTMLVLMNLTKVNATVKFMVPLTAVTDTLIYYACIMVLNLFANLWQVGKARPVELMQGSAKNEKEPKHIVFCTISGIWVLGMGYYYAVGSQVSSMIFIEFFLAVFLVVMGTYLLFTSGSLVLLKKLRKNKKYFYRADNFISVSGMLSRMKKNAASLSNICIFSTMVMITAICTLTIMFCGDSINNYTFPRVLELNVLGYENTDGKVEYIEKNMESLAIENGVELRDIVLEKKLELHTVKEGTHFVQVYPDASYEDRYAVELMTIDDYNSMEGTAYTLQPGEAIIFSSGSNYEADSVTIGGEEYRIAMEVGESVSAKKAANNLFIMKYIVALCDAEAVNRAAAAWGMTVETNQVINYSCNIVGEAGGIDSFFAAAKTTFCEMEGYAGLADYREELEAQDSMYGGLVFIGIFFGLIFIVCLLIIMYYKQISEGYEDQRNFEIMQKVGMGDEEIKAAIQKQIRLVFALPLAGAIIHTMVGMHMVVRLMAAISCFEVGKMILITLIVCLSFAVLYLFCYKQTCYAYYKIVKR